MPLIGMAMAESPCAIPARESPPVGFFAVALDGADEAGGFLVADVGEVVFAGVFVVAGFAVGFLAVVAEAVFVAGFGDGIDMPDMLPMCFIESAWAIESRLAFDD